MGNDYGLYVPDDEVVLLERENLLIRTAGTDTLAIHQSTFDDTDPGYITPYHVAIEDLESALEGLHSERVDSTATEAPTPDEILRNNAELYERKNEDYGGSWRLAGELFAAMAESCDFDEIDPTDEAEMISVGLFYQRLHKQIRSANLEFGTGDPNNEPIAESHRDESTYAAMHASLFGAETNAGSDGDTE